MSSASPKTKVAVVNSSPEVIDILSTYLESEGYETVTLHADDIKAGDINFIEFLKEHDPEVILYDISIPYEENWNFLQLIRNAEEAQGRRFVITTTNKDQLERLVGRTGAIEIVGKPFDLEQIEAAVKRRRP